MSPFRRRDFPWGEYRPPTREEIRVYAWLYERLSLLHRERRGWWARVRCFFGF